MKQMMRARTLMEAMIEFKKTYDLNEKKKMKAESEMKPMMRAKTFMEVRMKLKEMNEEKKKVKAERDSGDEANEEKNPHGDHDRDEQSEGNEEDEGRKRFRR